MQRQTGGIAFLITVALLASDKPRAGAVRAVAELLHVAFCCGPDRARDKSALGLGSH
jgi:hypothetical protein